jgi:HlyD family secretion protein
MQKRTSQKRIYAIIGAVVVLAGVGAFLFFRNQTPPTQAVQPGDTVTAFIGDLSASATASGTVTPRRITTLAAEIPGRVSAAYVRAGDLVQAGDVLMQLDSEMLALNVTAAAQNVRLREASLANLLAPSAAADIAAAEAALASAQANLDGLFDGLSDAERVLAEANVRAAEASVLSASASLGSARDSVTDAQIAAAEAAVQAAQLNYRFAREANEDNTNQATHQAMLQAEQQLRAAEGQLAALRDGPDLGAAQSSVAAAQARLDASRVNFDAGLSGPTAAQLAAAEAQVAQAQATLAALLSGPTAAQIAIAEAELAQAQLSLADAEAALQKGTLVAPFAGVVTAVNFQPGEFASGPAIELVDPATLEVVLEVDEVDVGRLRVGQTAVVTLETWPNDEIAAEVTAIAPRATTQLGSALVIYEARLSLDQTDLPILMGMTANANLVTAEKQNVLLVPNQAINADRSTGRFSVSLLVGEEVVETPVTIGLRDGRYTEITSGLNVGDTLVINAGAPLQSIFGNN